MAIWVGQTFMVFKFGVLRLGVLFSYVSIIFGDFYFGKSKEPRETCVIKFSQKIKYSTVHKITLLLHRY